MSEFIKHFEEDLRPFGLYRVLLLLLFFLFLLFLLLFLMAVVQHLEPICTFFHFNELSLLVSNLLVHPYFERFEILCELFQVIYAEIKLVRLSFFLLVKSCGRIQHNLQSLPFLYVLMKSLIFVLENLVEFVILLFEFFDLIGDQI